MSTWRVATVPVVLLWAMCSVLLVTGCGSDGGEEEAEAALPRYPPALSAESSPWQVAEVLIKALDEEDGQTLLGLVAIKRGSSEVDAIYAKYGRESKRSPAEVAGLAVSGWRATYAWFQAGTTQVTNESVTGDTAVVDARGVNPNTGRPRLLQVEMVREDGLWKVKPGLQSREL
jgi:hypothetical protein